VKPEGTFAVHAQVVMEDVVREGIVTVTDGMIASVDVDVLAQPEAELLEARDHYLLPGFIDLHVHGGNGHDFMDASADAFREITRFHAMNGTTAMLATTVTAPKEAIEEVLAAAERFRRQPMPWAELLGVHLEGPFISGKWPGAQNPAHIVPPQPAWIRDWLAKYPDLIRIVTLAPEIEGAPDMLDLLASAGIIASCGHTDATWSEIVDSIPRGLSHAAHLFNAMRGFHHREPGTVGAVLSRDELTAEMIADGVHVHPAALRMALHCKKGDGLILVTDAISAAGLGDGDYRLGGLEVTVKGGVARLKANGQLAGSTLTMIRAFRYMVREIGLSLPQASRLASLNPALRLGIERQTGSIAPGKRADLLLLSPDLEISRVWVRGRRVDGT
jgi:N-acetylglucosamine-6-phosphate deacetylase